MQANYVIANLKDSTLYNSIKFEYVQSTFKGEFMIEQYYRWKEEEDEIFSKPIHLITNMTKQNIHIIFNKPLSSFLSWCDFTVFYHLCSGSFPNDIYFLFSCCFKHPF